MPSVHYNWGKGVGFHEKQIVYDPRGCFSVILFTFSDGAGHR
jgi:hypothetical protein